SLPARPQRRPKAEPDAPPHPAYQETITRRNDRLHRATTPRRQDPTRSNSLPQALPRAQPLPPSREPTHASLTNIEASLAETGLVCTSCAEPSTCPTTSATSVGRTTSPRLAPDLSARPL